MRPLSRWLATPTYARGRLQLGIGGVGTYVLVACLMLALGVPRTTFDGQGGAPLTDASLLALWLAGVAVLLLPWEALGGYAVPKRFGRNHPALGAWAIGWLRGVTTTILVMSAAGTLVVAAGRAAGPAAALGTFGLVLLAMVALQAPVARLIGGLREVEPGIGATLDELEQLGVDAPRITVFDAADEGFTGGIAGLPSTERHVIPLAWVGRFEPAALAMLIARRTFIVDRGLRALGLTAALVWTIGTFTIASILPGAGLTDVAGFITTSLWFSLLSFVGLLVLPTPSRAGTRAADAWAVLARDDNTTETLRSTLEALDRLQDDEPERSDGVESVFHPIPSLGSRLRALESPTKRVAPWHVARTAVYLSIAGLNPLHRLVHCNVGRPELWVFLPADG